MASRLISRFAVTSTSKMNGLTQTRTLSSQTNVAIEKLRGALEEYRANNYTQEIPTRFKKDIVRAAKSDETDRVALEGMQRVITNINMQHRISHADMETIFLEIGGEARAIPADRLMTMI